MNKGQVIQQQLQSQNQSQIKKSLTNNFLNQRKNGSINRDFNQDMIQMIMQQQNLQRMGQNSTYQANPKIEIQNVNDGVCEGEESIQQKKQEDIINLLDRNLYLKTQQKLFAQNNKLPPRIISFDHVRINNVDKKLTIPSPSQASNNNEIINTNTENLRTEFHSENVLNTQDSPFNKTKSNPQKMRKTNFNYFSQSHISSKFSNNQSQSDKKEASIYNSQPNDEENAIKKIDPLSRVRLLKHPSTLAPLPLSFNLSQSSVIDKNSQSTTAIATATINKKFPIKDLKFDSSSIVFQGSNPSCLQNQYQFQQNTNSNSNLNTIGSQKNLQAQEIIENNKTIRSQSQNQQNSHNKRRYSANVNQQTQTPNQTNQMSEEKNGFSSFLNDYFQSMKEISPKYNNLTHTSDKMNINNPSLIKKAQIMSQFNKNNTEYQPYTPPPIQLNFPFGPYSQAQAQAIHSTKSTEKNQPGQISIQALIPSTKQIQSPHSISNNIISNNKNQTQNQIHQIFNIEDLQSIRQKAKQFPKNKIQLLQSYPTSLQDLQNIKGEEDPCLQDQQNNLATQVKSKLGLSSPKSFMENFNNVKTPSQQRISKLNHNHVFQNTLQSQEENQFNQLNINKMNIYNQEKETDYQILMQKLSKDDIFQSKDKQKFKQSILENKSLGPITLNKLDVINFEKEQGFYSLSTRRPTQPSMQQNATTSSTLTTSRQSLASISYQPKKKISSFQSQRDLPTSDTSSNQIDIAPFTNQNKENTHLQNLMQKIDEKQTQQPQNTQPKYRYLKSNISLDQSFDNEDEDFYNYTQNVKVQNLNSPINNNLNID